MTFATEFDPYRMKEKAEGWSPSYEEQLARGKIRWQ
jgi:hypothetical protein